MNRAFVDLEIKSLDDDKRIIEGWATTPEVDRVGDIVMPKGAKFKLPLPFLLDHDSEQVVGEVNFAEVTDKGIKFRAQIAAEAMIAAAKAARREPEGLWMPGSLRALEDAILEGRIRLRRNPVLISAMMSAVTEEDKWDNRWLSKQRSVNKIDAAVALCMAIGAASTDTKTRREPKLVII